MHCENANVKYITLALYISVLLHLSNDSLYYWSNFGTCSLPAQPRIWLPSASSSLSIRLIPVRPACSRDSVLTTKTFIVSYNTIFHKMEPPFLCKRWRLLFWKNSVILYWKSNQLRYITANDSWEPSVCFGFCWKQYVTFTHKLSRLQHEACFSIILCFQSWNLFLKSYQRELLLAACNEQAVCFASVRHRCGEDPCWEASVYGHFCWKQLVTSAY